MRKIKLFCLIPTPGIISETFISDLLIGLAEKDFDLIVAANDLSHLDKNNFPSQIKWIESHYLSLHSLKDRALEKIRPTSIWSAKRDTVFDKSTDKVIARLVQEHKPDIAYIEYGTTLTRCARALSKNNVPMIAHLHGADITTNLLEKGYPAALKNAFRDTQAIITASKHMRRLAILAGAAEDKINVIKLGVNLEGVQPKEWASRNTSPSFVFLGRLVKKKNPVALLEAFRLAHAQMPAISLHIIGDGPERAELETRINSYNLNNNVTLHGALARKQALSIVSHQWAYAQHSVTPITGDQEGFGLSLIHI